MYAHTRRLRANVSPNCSRDAEYLLRASYLEIYNEELYDLLDPDHQSALRIGEYRYDAQAPPHLKIELQQPIELMRGAARASVCSRLC